MFASPDRRHWPRSRAIGYRANNDLLIRFREVIRAGPILDALVSDGVIEVLARHDPAIVPGFDDSLTLEHGQLSLELIAQPLVRVRVGEEQRCHGSPLCWGGFNVPPLFLQGQRARFSQATDRSWFTVRRR